jgi:hypothetical protein
MDTDSNDNNNNSRRIIIITLLKNIIHRSLISIKRYSTTTDYNARP